jgi:hypothetical protein
VPISNVIKDLGEILVHEAKMVLKLKCLPPTGYNFELRKKLEKDWLI